MYFLLILFLSAVFCFGFVYPLWLFATESSHLYTFIILIFAAAGCIAFIVRILLRKLKSFTTDESKKKFKIRLIFSFCITVVLCIAIINAIKLVLTEQRVFALLILAAGLALSFILQKIRMRFSDV